MRLRILDFGLVSPIRSQAIFHGLGFNMAEDDDPLLCLCSPDAPYVSVGIHQEIGLEVDEDYCQRNSLSIYRRHVGGGAVYLDQNQLFTHFIYPRKKAPEYAVNLYPRFIEPVVRTYRDFGVDAEYRPVNDIHVRGRKIGGTGAASLGESTVMAGSFMFDFDTEKMSKCLKVPSEKFRDKLKSGLDDYMTTIIKELDAPPLRDDLLSRFFAHCADCLGVEPSPDDPTDGELAAIADQEAKLQDPEWTYRKGRKFVQMGVRISGDTLLTEAAHKAAGGMIRTRLLAKDGRIDDLMITGDFTCLPESGVEMLGESLRGEELIQGSLARRIDAIIKQADIEIPGVGADEIESAILAAVHKD
jgi:lipoate-protein ligase A